MNLEDQFLEDQFLKELEFLDARQSDVGELRELISHGWQASYAEWFGEKFVDVLAPHHIEAVEWHWESRLAFLENRKPKYLAYFPIWSRGHMKSTLAEHMVVADAMLSTAYGQPGYALYVARSKDKVQDHISNIETLMSSDGVRKWNPKLSNPQKTQITNQQRKWTATFLKSEANYSIQGGSLDSGLAGSRVEETRPTAIFFDDVDGREDSPVIAEARFRQLTTEVLPMRQGNTLVFFAQNLISRYSTIYRMWKGHSKALANRKPSEPVPAVLDLVTQQTVVDGIVKDLYVSGTPTWKAWDADRIQDEIDTYGLPAFEIECQHRVEQARTGQILHNYDDNVHVITESEFAAVYGSKDAWKYWSKWQFNDWARTKTEYHANVAGYLTVSSQNTPLPGFIFLLHPMSFEANVAPEDVAERLLSVLTPYAYDDVTWAQLRRDVLKRENADQYAPTMSQRIEYERTAISHVFPQYTREVLRQFNVKGGYMSHERDDIRRIYNMTYGMTWMGVNPKKFGGIEQWNRDLKVDYDTPHPFRPEQLGYSRWFVIVPDDKRDMPEHLKAADMHDSDLARHHFMNWLHAAPQLTVTGEAIDNILKLNDDFGNAIQMCYVQNLFSNVPMSPMELMDLATPTIFKKPELTESEKVAKQLWLQRYLKKEQEKKKPAIGLPSMSMDSIKKWQDIRK